MRAFLLMSCSVVALAVGACVGPQQRAENIAGMCGAGGEGWSMTAAPENAQAYRDVAGATAARYLRRRWPFHEYWFRSSAGQTLVCNVNPDWHEPCADNQYAAQFRDSASGPVKEDEEGAICVD